MIRSPSGGSTVGRMSELEDDIDRLATEIGFSGVVRVDRGDRSHARAYGLANRAYGVANTVETQFGIASGVKGMTALTVVSLIEDGTLLLTTRARDLLGSDLPLIDDRVTVEHLLGHRSGIGDYLDEDAGGEITDYAMPIGVHLLSTTEQYIVVLDGHPMKFAPGEQFAYCNSGYVVLALLAERATGVLFGDLVRARVLAPAGMHDTAFLRSDDLPARAATGYLSPPRGAGDHVDDRTNVLHLPVCGSGDGGLFSTVGDLHLFWRALIDGHVVSSRWVAEMTRARSDVPSQDLRYGLGFWLHGTNDAIFLEGYDAGVSFRSLYRPARGRPSEAVTFTVISNYSAGAWPVARRLAEVLM